jgi:hypothetical protein
MYKAIMAEKILKTSKLVYHPKDPYWHSIVYFLLFPFTASNTFKLNMPLVSAIDSVLYKILDSVLHCAFLSLALKTECYAIIVPFGH